MDKSTSNLFNHNLYMYIVGVRVGLLDTRFIVTESVDTAITVCAELQEGFLGRNISLMVVSSGSNGKLIIDS